MYKDDDILEDALSKFKDGQKLQDVVSQAKPESGELSSLVSLATSIRDLPHPEQGEEIARLEIG